MDDKIDLIKAKPLTNNQRGVISVSSVRNSGVGEDITQKVKSKYNL